MNREYIILHEQRGGRRWERGTISHYLRPFLYWEKGLKRECVTATELWSRLLAEVPGVQPALRLLLGVSSSPSLGMRVERSTAMEGRTERRGKEANSIGGT